jgi:AcrR family transcriptional regulator
MPDAATIGSSGGSSASNGGSSASNGGADESNGGSSASKGGADESNGSTGESTGGAGESNERASTPNGSSGDASRPPVAEPLTLPRGRHNLTREQVGTAQRERILTGMVQALAENGYARTTVADVIARAHTSRETFYEHFANKQACFLAAYQGAVDELTEAMRASFEQAPPVDAGGQGSGQRRGRFENALGAYLDAMASQPGLAHTFMIEVYGAGPEAWKRRAEVLERFGDVVFELARDEPALASFPDPRFAVRSLVAAISAMVTGLIAAGDYEALPGLRAPVMELLGAFG